METQTHSTCCFRLVSATGAVSRSDQLRAPGHPDFTGKKSPQHNAPQPLLGNCCAPSFVVLLGRWHTALFLVSARTYGIDVDCGQPLITAVRGVELIFGSALRFSRTYFSYRLANLKS